MNEIRAISFALGFFDGKLFHKSICHGLNPGGMGWSALHHAEELLPYLYSHEVLPINA
jgi:hypothetical protein